MRQNKGEIIGLTIIVAWVANLFWLLQYDFKPGSPVTWMLILLQMHLYTGLFITAHDAMHGVVSENRKWNKAIGWVAALLFAYNWYPRLFRKHHQHHRFVATDKDPDYHKGNFVSWYGRFALQYVTVWQIIAMAGTYHLLLLAFPRMNLILFWIAPSVLATFQLFIFGTYLPHRGKHEAGNLHKSRSQSANHLIAFFTCYFFGYHYEHHASPGTPWWGLWKVKEENLRKTNTTPKASFIS